MSKKPPVKERRVLVESPRPKRFVHERLELPDGKPCDWYYLDVPDDSVIVVPITAHGKVVLVRQVRWNLGEHGLELPAGSCQPGEAPEVAAARELLEETGFAIDPSQMKPLGRFYVLPSETNKHVRIFGARPVEKRGEPKHDKELERYFDMSVIEMEFDEALGAIGTKIQGIETIAALQLAAKSFGSLP